MRPQNFWAALMYRQYAKLHQAGFLLTGIIKQAKLRLTITSRVKILKRSTYSIDVLLLYTPHNHLVQAHIQIN